MSLKKNSPGLIVSRVEGKTNGKKSAGKWCLWCRLEVVKSRGVLSNEIEIKGG